MRTARARAGAAYGAVLKSGSHLGAAYRFLRELHIADVDDLVEAERLGAFRAARAALFEAIEIAEDVQAPLVHRVYLPTYELSTGPAPRPVRLLEPRRAIRAGHTASHVVLAGNGAAQAMDGLRRNIGHCRRQWASGDRSRFTDREDHANEDSS